MFFNDNPQTTTDKIVDAVKRLYVGMAAVVITVKFAEIVSGKKLTP
jgi:hypothetical protein